MIDPRSSICQIGLTPDRPEGDSARVNPVQQTMAASLNSFKTAVFGPWEHLLALWGAGVTDLLIRG
jgi:hypothetical protein